MIQKWHPVVARLIVAQLSGGAEGPHLSGASMSRERLLDASYAAPSWVQIADGLRPNRPEEVVEPGVPRHGWQFFASQAVEDCFFQHGFVPRLTDTQQAMIRSQSGPMAGVPLVAFPHVTSVQVRCVCVSCAPPPPPLVPPPSVFVRLGVAVHAFGHHRSACAVSGVLGRRGFALESAAARICREAGGRVTLNVRVNDLDLPPRGAQDQRRLEVVADGLPLFHGAQLAIDTTMVSTEREGGWCSSCAREAPERDHVPRALGSERPCPFGGPGLRSGRWSVESTSFLSPRRSRSGMSRLRFAPAPVTLGSADGALSWPAARPGPSPHPCWSCVVGLALMVPHPRALR